LPRLASDTANQELSRTTNPHWEHMRALAERAAEPMALADRYRREYLVILPIWLAAKAARIRAEPTNWNDRDTRSFLKASCA
jgi:hypothetical protein